MKTQYSITDFNAVSSTKVPQTEAIQSAIDEASNRGGGCVLVPEGTYLTGAIFLKPGVDLRIEGTLLGSSDINHYPSGPTRFEGRTEEWPCALINVVELSHFTLSGNGHIDGNGIPFYRQFWQERDKALALDAPFVNRDVPRPRLVFIEDCRNVTIEGITLQNSGFWNIHLYNSDNIFISNISVRSRHDTVRAASTDAIDIDACQNVVIDHCSFEVDDDCVCLKGGKGPGAYNTNRATRNITVQNCTFGFGHGVVTFGSEACNIENVTIRDTAVTDSNTLVRFKFRGDTKQIFKQISFSDIKMKKGCVFSIQPWVNRQDEVLGEGLPSLISGLSVNNVEAVETDTPGLILADPPTTVIEKMSVTNVKITTTETRKKTTVILEDHDNNEAMDNLDIRIENISDYSFDNFSINGVTVS